jgi:hypothetical protein
MGIENSYSNLFLILKNKLRLFLLVSLISIILAIVFSSAYFITPKYKSEADLYPSNLTAYSNESETEQLLQLFFGNDIRDSIFNRFDLIHHYNIDTSKKAHKSILVNEFTSNVLIKKTNFESVHIEVLDKDPILARDIVQEFINQVNKKIKALHQQKAKEVLIIRENELVNKKQLIDTLESKIQYYSIKYGLLDYVEQSREVTAGYMNMLLQSKKGQEMQKAEDLYENLKAEGSRFQDLHLQLNLARIDYNKILISYEESLRDINKNLTYTNTVVFPEVADKKAYPIRWLIVLMAFFASNLLVFITLLFINRLKQV